MYSGAVEASNNTTAAAAADVWGMSYKGGQVLRDTVYTDLVTNHVLRPFQTMIAPEGKIRLSDYYSRIPDLADENPEWWDLVIDRLSRCYSKIEYGVIDLDSPTGRRLFRCLAEKGVEFYVPKRRR